MIELVIVACLWRQPGDCSELRVETGFKTVGSCEDNGLILVAGEMLSHPDLKASRFHCEQVPEHRDT